VRQADCGDLWFCSVQDFFENCALIREANTELPNDYWDYYYADGTGEVLREVHTVTADYTGDAAYVLAEYTP
jgi:hypothetical protein